MRWGTPKTLAVLASALIVVLLAGCTSAPSVSKTYMSPGVALDAIERMLDAAGSRTISSIMIYEDCASVTVVEPDRAHSVRWSECGSTPSPGDPSELVDATVSIDWIDLSEPAKIAEAAGIESSAATISIDTDAGGKPNLLVRAGAGKRVWLTKDLVPVPVLDLSQADDVEASWDELIDEYGSRVWRIGLWNEDETNVDYLRANRAEPLRAVRPFDAGVLGPIPIDGAPDPERDIFDARKVDLDASVPLGIAADIKDFTGVKDARSWNWSARMHPTEDRVVWAFAVQSDAVWGEWRYVLTELDGTYLGTAPYDGAVW